MCLSYHFISVIVLSSIVYLILNYDVYNIIKSNSLLEVKQNIILNISSVDCIDNYADRSCEFKNIYYKVSSKEFVFIRGDNNTSAGLPEFKDFANEAFVDVS